jgi:protein required for attachment to host cells
MTHYILVADAARGRLIGADDALQRAEEIEDFVHPASRVRTEDLVTDQKTDSTGQPDAPRSSTEEPDAHANESRKFAHELARSLGVARASGAFARLILVAPPKFLGMLREELDAPTKRTVVASVAKDYTHQSIEETLAAIREQVTTSSS